jgi:hypothetical protein
VAVDQGYVADKYQEGSGDVQATIYICHQCKNPTYFSTRGSQTPGIAYGKDVEHVPVQDVSPLYNEARMCMSVNAYTAAILCCRKLLMNIAVAQGAKDGQRFAEYVDYLSDNGYLPPNGKKWVDAIRKKGNEATHEITIMDRADAEELIEFTEMLLRFIYEYPARIDQKIQQTQTGNP